MKIALGQVTAHVVSASITSLVDGVLTSMLLNTFKMGRSGRARLRTRPSLVFGVVARQNSAATNEKTLPAMKPLTVNSQAEEAAPPFAARMLR